MTAPIATPGWYPDPSGSGGERYWDGQAWTVTRPAPQPKRITVNYGFALLAVFSLLGTLFFGLPLVSNGANVVGMLWLMWGGMWTLIWTAFAVQHTLRSR
ncbi:hypothetical protein FGG33_gp67 [Mycobacterium phage Benedict]|uniref:DUF2510 domain-containing protein n=1 Tax=Mycobacterium phage Benedict TaxID=2902890 RepID=G1EDH7_9CAUD|nr:hypothetical protein FGG33_gp67 [Mycobacterium phage Benedict]AEJ93486.1 hypothetical protein BENEDICT_30 [Mycobacterium phage Benedict]